MMKYQSTRGCVSGLRFEDVVMGGYAPDGGMFMPQEIPQLTSDDIASWSSLSYVDIVKQICYLFIQDEISQQTINEIVDRAFSAMDDPFEPIKTLKLSSEIICLEMFHGKSLAFKDLSMNCAAQFIQYFLKLRKSRVTFLIATSGDTGSSALNAVAGLDNVDIVVLLPKDRISKAQELQMTTVVADNCYVIRADGTSDDTDVPIQKIFCDEKFVAEHSLSSLNSVNWCRVMIQIAHHFYAYFQGQKLGHEETTSVYIPTGGLGNATAACVARAMGLPINIVCAVTNDALLRAVERGDYSASQLHVSLAPAINIQVPYNFERILYLLSNMDVACVSKHMTEYRDMGKTLIPTDLLDKLSKYLSVKLVSDKDIVATMKKCFEENEGYTICPHTATALTPVYNCQDATAAAGLVDQKKNLVVYAAASPLKFSDVIEKAGIEWKSRNLLQELKTKKCRYKDWSGDSDWTDQLKSLVCGITAKRSGLSAPDPLDSFCTH